MLMPHFIQSMQLFNTMAYLASFKAYTYLTLIYPFAQDMHCVVI